MDWTINLAVRSLSNEYKHKTYSGTAFFKPVMGQTLFFGNGDEDDWVLSSSFGLLYIVVLGTYLYILSM